MAPPNHITHLAKLEHYEELLNFYNDRGEDLLRPGSLPRLPGSLEDRLFDWKWNRIVIIRTVETSCIIGAALLSLQMTLRLLAGSVEYVLVDCDFRGMGIARILMARLHREARELGVRHIQLISELERPAARALYQSLGYQLVKDSQVHFYLHFDQDTPDLP